MNTPRLTSLTVGNMDVVTPLKIALFSNLLNVLVDPLLIFDAKMGVAGAAAATCLAEASSFLLYMRELTRRKLIDVRGFKLPKWESLKPLLLGGVGVQVVPTREPPYHSLTHSLTHSFTHSLIHSPTHSLTHVPLLLLPLTRCVLLR